MVSYGVSVRAGATQFRGFQRSTMYPARARLLQRKPRDIIYAQLRNAI